MRGLLGKHLSHSFSKEIHERIDHKPYNLIELEDLDGFFHNRSFQALNVTIPYKTDVIKYLDFVSDDALKIGVVNTIINENGNLSGYNTDIDGLSYTFEYNNISLDNKVVAILGNGATSKTIKHFCEKNHTAKVIVFARRPKEGEFHLDEISKYKEINIIVNATPHGMYPNSFDEALISLDPFISLEFVFDLIYNPIRTNLILQAESKNIKAVNGLMMLVHQAVVANGLFSNIIHPKELTNTIYKEMFLKQINLVLIGMPMSGKTYYTRELSNIYNKEMFDIDRQIEYTQEKSIPEIFSIYGESVFREIEKSTILELSKQLNKGISTGGGVILDPQNIEYLKHNGVLLFLDMSLNDLKKCNPKQRPLLQDPKNLEIMFNQRYELYNKYCDIRIKKRGFKQKETLKQIEVKLNEYIST